MPSMKPIRRVTGSMVVAVVALGMVALSTLAVAGPAGAAATKPTGTNPTATKPPTAARHALSRASRLRLDREIRYDCLQARKWLHGQGGLEARYSKRLVKLQGWEAQAKADGATKIVTRLERDIRRVEARKALVKTKAPASAVAQTQKAEATQAKCAVMAAWAIRHSKGTPASRKAAKEARARMKVAEGRAAEARAAATAKAKAAKGKATTPPKTTTTTSTTTPPAKSTTTTSTTTPSTTTSTNPPTTPTSSTPVTAAKS